MARGRLIALEGGEGCGKSTQARLLAERLGAVLTHEPGGTPLGRTVRDVVLHGGAHVDARAETLLLLADRAQDVAEVIGPALDAGRDVVTDRFSHSTLAYQGYGRGLDLGELRSLCTWATGGLWPDVAILLELPPGVAAARTRGPTDRLEAAGDHFHARVATGYASMAAAEPSAWLVVDGTGTVDAVAERVAAAYDCWRPGGVEPGRR